MQNNQQPFLNRLAEKLLNTAPESFSTTREELHQWVKAAAQDALLKMDLLPRDEFDAQVRVLHRLQQKVTELEAQLKELEQAEDSSPEA